MKWALIVIGVLVVLIGFAWIIGALLPRTHTASRTARFKQKPQAMFDAIANWREYSSWRTGLKEVRERQGAEGRASWVEVSSFGQMPIEVVESDPPKKIVGRIVDPEHKLAFGGTWTYEIKPTIEGCSLTITENGEIYPAPFRFMARFIFGYTSTMEGYLKALGRKFGEEAQFEKH